MRIGKRPSKSLYLKWAKNDLRRLKPARISLDLACGTMYFRQFLPTEEYIGVDVLQDRLDKGLSRYPDAKAICGKIEDLSSAIKADIVLCFETIGINSWFDLQATRRCIEKIISATRKDGMVLLNLGYRVADLQAAIIERFNRDFSSVEYKYYGRWHFQTNPIFSFLLGQLMDWIPPLRTCRTSPWVYVKAQKKL